ncbi:putative gamma-glutamyltransferase YwrD [Zancudomyces culisetae]|uniref:Putative gamma-glutamyltransferase YwrD n=1 Tax=Zancudomyces culisetae TaxID=1213189 RepID=A0A1R1PEA6_ZANCU|nr:putative gamma-glutamyltransferase YwrD [Zancudomyces culisetae]|eukprot:OMH79291.1 putative gamma-glutamyltransferase YwrD [Zancudomyces culisetae]
MCEYANTQPKLSRTLRLLVENGKDGFYKGPVGEAIINAIQEARGKMCLDDLENHKTAFVDPIHYEHNGFKVYECPPNGQGIVALQALGVLDSLVEDGKIPDIGKIQHNSAEYLHILIECLRLAFADAFHYVADPDHIPDPQLLLSRDYLKTRADLFNHDVKNECITNGELPISCDTVYFSVVDQDGNGCSFIGIIPKGCGFTLQNRGCGFSLNTQGYNLYQPEKRPYHTIIPSMITKNDELHAVFGVMGGYMQPQGHLQVLLNLLHFGMDPQRSLDQPRFCIDVFEDIVFIEDGIDSIEAVESALKRKGHNIIVKKSYERAVFGRGQVIIRSSSQSKKHAEQPLNTGDSLGSACEDSIILAVGSDPRSDGCASAR